MTETDEGGQEQREPDRRDALDAAARLLVVGAAGQLGADMVRFAPEHGFRVDGLGRDALDVGDEEAVREVLDARRFDVLVNCTAHNDTAGAESDPDSAFRVNARAPGWLAAAARRAGARFLHVSTDYVFDGRLGRPYTETDPPAPLGVYGASKLTGEARARTAHPEGSWVVRTAGLFGRAGIRRGGNFIETILRTAAERDRVQVVDDLVLSPTATEDLARALLDLIGANADPGLYHGVNRGQATWFQLASAAIEGAGVDVEIEPVPASTFPSPFPRPPFSALDCGRLEAVVGPVPHWREGLERYLEARAHVLAETTP